LANLARRNLTKGQQVNALQGAGQVTKFRGAGWQWDCAP
jgi:hypothetical protein